MHIFNTLTFHGVKFKNRWTIKNQPFPLGYLVQNGLYSLRLILVVKSFTEFMVDVIPQFFRVGVYSSPEILVVFCGAVSRVEEQGTGVYVLQVTIKTEIKNYL